MKTPQSHESFFFLQPSSCKHAKHAKHAVARCCFENAFDAETGTGGRARRTRGSASHSECETPPLWSRKPHALAPGGEAAASNDGLTRAKRVQVSTSMYATMLSFVYELLCLPSPQTSVPP